MSWRLAADAVLLLHAAFVAFVVLGGLGWLRWRWWPLVHAPALAWGVFVELSGRLCPLTGLENTWRRRAGDRGYDGGFVEQVLLPLLYPEGLSRPMQGLLAALALAVNAAIYAWCWHRRRHRVSAAPGA